MERMSKSQHVKIVSAVIGLVVLLGVVVYQTTDIRQQMWFYEEPLCSRAADWSRDSAIYRRGYLETTANYPAWNEWTDETYDTLIHQMGDDIAWLENNPPPAEAEVARESYIEHIEAIRNILIAAKDGEFASHDEFVSAISVHYDPLIMPATMYMSECSMET